MFYLICHLSKCAVTIVKALLKFSQDLQRKIWKFMQGLLKFSSQDYSYTLYKAGAGLSSAGFETKMNDLKQFFNRTAKEKK